MIDLKKLLFPALGLLAVTIVACGGGGGGATSAIPKTGVPATKEKVAVRIVIPSAAGVSLSQKLRRRFTEAQSTQGLSIVVTPQTTSSPIVLSQSFDISASSALCATQPDQSRLCTLPLLLAPTSYTVNVTTYDQAPVSGVISGTANKLGIASLPVTVTAGGVDTISLALNGIAASVNVTLPVPIVHTLAAFTEQATVSVLDTDNDVIVANNYVDTNGNAVTVSFTSNSAFTTWNTTSITEPSGNGVGLTWNPSGFTSAEMLSGISATLTAKLSSNSATGTATLSAPAPLTTVAISAPAYGITASSSTLYFSLPGSQAIQSYVPSTGAIGAPTPLASSGPIGSSPRPADVLYNPGDGNIYFTMSNNAAIGFIPSVPGTYEQGVPLSANGVTLAADGTNNVWSTEPTSDYLVYTPPSPNTSVREQPSPGPAPAAGAGFFQIAFGTGDNMWFTENSLSKIGMWNASSGLIEKAVPTGSSGPEGITQGPSGDMWFAEFNTKKLGEIAAIFPSTINEFTTGAAQPVYVVGAPDGNVWFDYSLPNPGVGRMTPTGTLTLFPLPNTVTPGQMTVVGGQIWIVDTATPTLYGLSP